MVAAGAIFCAALCITACHSRTSDAGAGALSAPPARVAVAQRGDIAHVLTLAGQFQPYQVVDVHPKVSGYMRKIDVDIGDVVHQGQTLAVLEVPELKAELQQTAFAFDQAKEEITQAEHEVSRAEATHAALHGNYERLLEASKGQPGLIAQQELDDARAKDLASESQIDAAKAAMAAARQHAGMAEAENQRVQALHSYTTVQAPISGVVAWRYADTGALIQGGTDSNTQVLPIVRIAQSSRLRLRVPVPENAIRYIHEGDQLSVRVDAIGRAFAGKIVRFTRSLNFETRTMETEVDVDNRDLSIATGMYANTMLRLAHVENVVTIPTEAVVLEGGQRVVYVVDRSNHVDVRPVQVGLEGSKLVEIRSGLSAGDRVILGAQEKYQENQLVSPETETTQSSETLQETGGMIDLKSEESIAGQNGPQAADERQSGHAGVESTRSPAAGPGQRSPKPVPDSPR